MSYTIGTATYEMPVLVFQSEAECGAANSIISHGMGLDMKYSVQLDEPHKDSNGVWYITHPITQFGDPDKAIQYASGYSVGELNITNNGEDVKYTVSYNFDVQKSDLIARIKKEKDAVDFVITVTSSAKGEARTYTINMKTFTELQQQVGMGKANILCHDDSRTMHEIYTLAEAIVLFTDITKASTGRSLMYDIYLTRATNATNEDDLNAVFSSELTADEQKYIADMSAVLLG